MTEPAHVSFGYAFVSGLLSFITPCVLPLVPVNIALISGMSVDALTESRRGTVAPTVFRTFLFIAGFSTVFTLMGAGAGAAGAFLIDHRDLIRIIGGVAVIVFGLHMTGLVPIPFFYRASQSATAKLGQRFGLVGIYLMGMSFAISWQPCVDPFLGSILALAATDGHTGRGIALLLTYSGGLGLPFLIAAAAMSAFLRVSRGLKRWLHAIEVASGALLIVLGLLLLTNRFVLLSRWAARMQSAPAPAGEPAPPPPPPPSAR